MRRRIQTALSDFVPPAHAGTLCFWGEESTYDHVEIDYGQGVRLKTKGDSPFLGEAISYEHHLCGTGIAS